MGLFVMVKVLKFEKKYKFTEFVPIVIKHDGDGTEFKCISVDELSEKCRELYFSGELGKILASDGVKGDTKYVEVVSSFKSSLVPLL
jgi:uncharacterized protein (UPF0248 family)